MSIRLRFLSFLLEYVCAILFAGNVCFSDAWNIDFSLPGPRKVSVEVLGQDVQSIIVCGWHEYISVCAIRVACIGDLNFQSVNTPSFEFFLVESSQRIYEIPPTKGSSLTCIPRASIGRRIPFSSQWAGSQWKSLHSPGIGVSLTWDRLQRIMAVPSGVCQRCSWAERPEIRQIWWRRKMKLGEYRKLSDTSH